MNRGQVLVRALKTNGKWGNVDVLDLDDESFRAWIVDKLLEQGSVIGLRTPYPPIKGESERILLREKILS